MRNYLMMLASWKMVKKFVTPALITELNRALMGFVTSAFIAEVNGAL